MTNHAPNCGKSFHEIRAIAARVYDQDSHSEADLKFLDDLWKADSDWDNAMHTAKVLCLQTGTPNHEAWEASKHLAARQQEAAYKAAYAALQTPEVEEVAQAEAAE